MAEQDKSLSRKQKSATYAERRKAEKDEALRDYVRGLQYIHAINRDLDREDITQEELPVIKYKTETRLKLLNKVIPDLKAIEHSGNVDHNLTIIDAINAARSRRTS